MLLLRARTPDGEEWSLGKAPVGLALAYEFSCLGFSFPPSFETESETSSEQRLASSSYLCPDNAGVTDMRATTSSLSLSTLKLRKEEKQSMLSLVWGTFQMWERLTPCQCQCEFHCGHFCVRWNLVM